MKRRKYYRDHRKNNDWHHVETTGFPYFNSEDVRRIYEVINGSSRGADIFVKSAKEEVAEKIEKDYSICYRFKNEDALFLLFEQRFSQQFKNKKISCWGELMQYIS